MMRIVFEYFLLSILAVILGANNLGGFSLSLSRVLVMAFMALTLLSLAVQVLLFQSPRWIP